MAIDTIGTNAIANDAVTAAKIPAGAVDADITAIPDGSVTTAKIADNAVTSAKLYAENLGRRNLILKISALLWYWSEKLFQWCNWISTCDRFRFANKISDQVSLGTETQSEVLLMKDFKFY